MRIPIYLIGTFKQSSNGKELEITSEEVIFEGVAYNITWIESHTFHYTYKDDNVWYYIRNNDGYEVIKYIPSGVSHQLKEVEQQQQEGRRLGTFTQSSNNKPIEITETQAIFEGESYDLTWIENHAFYFKWHGNFWYYIANDSIGGYEVIKYIPNSGYHTLSPIKPEYKR